jgi:hypothetical protein
MNKIAFLTRAEKKRKSRLKPVRVGKTFFKKSITGICMTDQKVEGIEKTLKK